MAPAFDPQGLLDVSKLDDRSFAPLPKVLAAYSPTGQDSEPGPLFLHAPEFGDLDALLRARAVDDSLHACFSSLLGGLSAGPAVLMGAFRGLDEQSVAVRMHAPARPKPFGSLPPIYFRVSRSHAGLAVRRGWVAANAAPWLALYTAVYYALIGDAKKFYSREDLGGPDNAAWLVFYGKDSARADYPDAEAEVGSGGGPAKAAPLTSLYAALFAFGSDGAASLDRKLLTEQVFAAATEPTRQVAARYAKDWQRVIAKSPPTKVAALAKVLAAGAALPEAALGAWLSAQSALSADLRACVAQFLELNGALGAKAKTRYSPAARSLWQGISDCLAGGVPVALELDGDVALSDAVQAHALPGGTQAISLTAVRTIELGKGEPERSLRQLLCAARPGMGQQLEVVRGEPWRSLRRARSNKPSYPLDAEQVLEGAVAVHVGAKALALQAPTRAVPNFTLAIPRNRTGPLKWPR